MFWEEFNTVIVAKGKPFSVRKPTTDHWYDVAIGTSEAHLAINLVNKESDHWRLLIVFLFSTISVFKMFI